MKNFSSKKISLTALFLALGIIVPFLFHQFALAGRIFSPMHIPVFLAGIFVSPLSGVIVGILSPLISFFLTGMPPAYAVPLMTIELPLYGLCIGFLIRIEKLPLIIALVISMILGRFGFALGLLILSQFFNMPYGLFTFLKVSLIVGLPGIIIQLILIPLLVKGIGMKR